MLAIAYYELILRSRVWCGNPTRSLCVSVSLKCQIYKICWHGDHLFGSTKLGLSTMYKHVIPCLCNNVIMHACEMTPHPDHARVRTKEAQQQLTATKFTWPRGLRASLYPSRDQCARISFLCGWKAVKLLDFWERRKKHSNSKCNYNFAHHNYRESRGNVVELSPNFRRCFDNPCTHGNSEKWKAMEESV